MYIGRVEPYIDGVTTWGGKGDKSCTGHQGRWCKDFYHQQCINLDAGLCAWSSELGACQSTCQCGVFGARTATHSCTIPFEMSAGAALPIEL